MIWIWPWTSSNHQIVVVECHFCTTQLELFNPFQQQEQEDDDTQPLVEKKGKRKKKASIPKAFGRTKRDWICQVCDCRNRFNQNGQILSNNPTHYDSRFNSESYSTRAGTSSNLLELNRFNHDSNTSSSSSSTSSLSPFCRICLSNQSLQIHLLASFEEEEEEQQPSGLKGNNTEDLIKAYRISLDQRYPMVCNKCSPRIEKIIQERDYRTKTFLLANRLRAAAAAAATVGSNNTETKLNFVVFNHQKDNERLSFWMILIWRLRGIAWYTTWVFSILFTTWIYFDFQHNHPAIESPSLVYKFILLLLGSSLLWTNWDPTWLTFQKSLHHHSPPKRRRRLKVLNKKVYIFLQMASYLLRLVGFYYIFYYYYHSQHHQQGILVEKNDWILGIFLLLQIILFIFSFRTIRLVQLNDIKLPPSDRFLNKNNKGGGGEFKHQQSVLTLQDELEEEEDLAMSLRNPIENLDISSNSIAEYLLKSSSSSSLLKGEKSEFRKRKFTTRNLFKEKIYNDDDGCGNGNCSTSRLSSFIEPKFGQAWIHEPPITLTTRLLPLKTPLEQLEGGNDEEPQDVEMNQIESTTNFQQSTAAESRPQEEEERIHFFIPTKSKIKWGWNEPSSGLDDLFVKRLKVVDDDDDDVDIIEDEEEEDVEMDLKDVDKGLIRLIKINWWKSLNWFGG